MKDILLTDDNDLMIVNGDFVIGDSTWQDVGIILQMNPGEMKSDPITGAGLVRKIRSNTAEGEIQQIVKLQLARDGKNYNELKNQILIDTDE